MKPGFTHTRCHGFTLLELMVVLVLMGVILSMMTLSVGDGGKYRRLEEEAVRLKTLLGMAQEEVILHSQEWTVVFKENGYQFEREETEQTGIEAGAEDGAQAVAGDGVPDKANIDKSLDLLGGLSGGADEGTEKKKMVPIEDKIFRARELPGYRLSIIIDGDEYPADTEEDGEETIGRVQLYTSGEMTEFELTIQQEDGEDQFVLKGAANGELTLTSSRDDET